jgi:hypothetical protein
MFGYTKNSEIASGYIYKVVKIERPFGKQEYHSSLSLTLTFTPGWWLNMVTFGLSEGMNL